MSWSLSFPNRAAFLAAAVAILSADAERDDSPEVLQQKREGFAAARSIMDSHAVGHPAGREFSVSLWGHATEKHAGSEYASVSVSGFVPTPAPTPAPAKPSDQPPAPAPAMPLEETPPAVTLESDVGSPTGPPVAPATPPAVAPAPAAKKPRTASAKAPKAPKGAAAGKRTKRRA